MKISTSAESHLKVNILLETREDGSMIASILELPQYRVEAATREQALLKLNQLLVQHLEKIEVIPMEIELSQTRVLILLRKPSKFLMQFLCRYLRQKTKFFFSRA
ncbi:MAG: hypothetical protein ACYTXF_29100 [Nostoc sp.]